jgi:hypothetical protein
VGHLDRGSVAVGAQRTRVQPDLESQEAKRDNDAKRIQNLPGRTNRFPTLGFNLPHR